VLTKSTCALLVKEGMVLLLISVSTRSSSHPILLSPFGSLFVFKGPYRAVLISYPSLQQKDDLIHAAQSSAAGQGRRD
jgi:hypothetical protein